MEKEEEEFLRIVRHLEDFGKWNGKGRRGMEFLRIVRHLEDFGNWNGKGRGGVEFLRIVRHIWTILESGMGKEEEWNF